MAGALSDYLALLVAPVGTAWQLRWAGELVAGIGPVSLSAGRAPGQTGFAAPGGGVVLGGEAFRDRVAFQIFRPVDIYIGLLTFDLSLATLGEPAAFRQHPALAVVDPVPARAPAHLRRSRAA